MEKRETLILGVEEVADLLGMTPRALRMRLHRGVGAPRPMRLGGSRTLAWKRQDVEAWIDLQAAAAGADYATQSAAPSPQDSSRRRGRPRKADSDQR